MLRRRSPKLLSQATQGGQHQPLHACGCLHFWGPCDVFHAVKDCVNKLCYLPITVHKMKRVEWYASWWQFLSGREAEQLAQLDAAEAEASTRSIARRKAT